MTRTLFCLLVVCCFLSKVYWSTSPVQNQCNAVSKVTEWLKKWIPIREIEGLSACRKYKTETIATPYKHETEMIRKTMAGSSDGKKANSFEERKFNTCTYMNENFTQICSNQMKQIIAAKLWPLSQEKYGHWDEAACDRIAANSLQAERSTDNYSISWSIKSSAAVEDQAIEVALKADDQSEAIENQSASLVCQIMLLKQAVPHQTTPSELPTKESIESSKALHSYKGFQRSKLRWLFRKSYALLTLTYETEELLYLPKEQNDSCTALQMEFYLTAAIIDKSMTIKYAFLRTDNKWGSNYSETWQCTLKGTYVICPFELYNEAASEQVGKTYLVHGRLRTKSESGGNAYSVRKVTSYECHLKVNLAFYSSNVTLPSKEKVQYFGNTDVSGVCTAFLQPTFIPKPLDINTLSWLLIGDIITGVLLAISIMLFNLWILEIMTQNT